MKFKNKIHLKNYGKINTIIKHTEKLVMKIKKLEAKLNRCKIDSKITPIFMIRRKNDNGFDLDIMKATNITTFEDEPAYSFNTIYMYEDKVLEDGADWFVQSADKFYTIVTQKQMEEHIKKYNKKYKHCKVPTKMKNKFLKK